MPPPANHSGQSFLGTIARFWKERRADMTIFAVIVLVGFLSFGLGYTAAQDSAHTSIIIEQHSGK